MTLPLKWQEKLERYVQVFYSVLMSFLRHPCFKLEIWSLYQYSCCSGDQESRRKRNQGHDEEHHRRPRDQDRRAGGENHHRSFQGEIWRRHTRVRHQCQHRCTYEWFYGFSIGFYMFAVHQRHDIVPIFQFYRRRVGGKGRTVHPHRQTYVDHRPRRWHHKLRARVRYDTSLTSVIWTSESCRVIYKDAIPPLCRLKMCSFACKSWHFGW